MELLKRNIHMDRICCKADTQFTLEDDVNLSDNKPDITKILFFDGNIATDDLRCLENHIHVKGQLCFRVLYESEDAFGKLFCMQGSLPFEESLNADGIQSSDTPTVHFTLENLTISLINSRKLSVKSLIRLSAGKEELYDEEVSIGIEGNEPVECRKISHNFCGIQVQKKDVFRIKAEQELPSNYPNIDEILWQNMQLTNIEFKTPDDKISLRGDLAIFIIYRPQTEESGYQFYETSLPFSGNMECFGCNESMIPDIQYKISQKDIDIRPDLDGEERILGIDMVLDLMIKLYVEENLEMIHDLYGISGDITTQTKTGYCKKLLGHGHSKHRIAEQVQVDTNGKNILSLRHSEGSVIIDNSEVGENCIEIEGTLLLNSLFMTDDDHFPYASIEYEVPFSYTLEMADITPECKYRIDCVLEDLTVTNIGEGEFDVKAIVTFSSICHKDEPITLLCNVSQTEPNLDKMNSLPGMVAYYAKEGDSLWQIGKEYYVPVSRIREVNNLTSDVLHAGDKLIIMK